MLDNHFEFVLSYIDNIDDEDKLLEAIKVLALMEIANNTEYIG